MSHMPGVAEMQPVLARGGDVPFAVPSHTTAWCSSAHKQEQVPAPWLSDRLLWHRGPSRAPAFHGTRHPPGKCTQPGRCSNFSCFSPTLENNSIFLNICTEEKVDFHCLCRVKMLLYLKEVGKNWHTTSHNTLTQLKVLCPPAAVSALTLHNQKERENCQIMLSRLDIFSN